MTHLERNGAPEPANLDDVQATDRMLSRLGARTPEPGDLDDPVFGALAALAREVDHEETSTEDEAMRRLVDALGGRPLYVLDGEDLLDPEAGADLVLIDDPAWDDEPRPTRVIDLTTAATEVAEEDEPAAPAAEPPAAAESPAAEPPAAAARVTELRPGLAAKLAATRPAGGWQAAARKLPLPVAAAIAVFALGGGITSALMGNPIAPVTGIVDALPGGEEEPSVGTYSLASVEQTLVQAQRAVAIQDYDTARALFAKARDQVAAVDPAQAREAQQKFMVATAAAPDEALPADVSLPPVPPAADPGPAAPAPSAAATQPPQATPTTAPTTPVEPTPTAPPPTPDPTPTTPSPTGTPADAEPSTAVSPAAVATTP